MNTNDMNAPQKTKHFFYRGDRTKAAKMLPSSFEIVPFGVSLKLSLRKGCQVHGTFSCDGFKRVDFMALKEPYEGCTNTDTLMLLVTKWTKWSLL